LAIAASLGLLLVPVGTRAQSRQPEFAESGGIDLSTAPTVATCEQSAPTVFVGRVLGPGGAPASGAVVVTSAGGQAVTNAEGCFSVEVDLPAEAERVRVTAAMGSRKGSLVGSVQVSGLARWGTTPAGTLVLEQAASC